MYSKLQADYYKKREMKIIELAEKGWSHKSIARMMKIKNPHTVTMVIWRVRHKEE